MKKRIVVILVLTVGTLSLLALTLNNYRGKQMHDEEKHSGLDIPSEDEIARLPKDGGPEFNRLIFEKSPYLLQHARNPVDWYPWGAEAFEKARREDKPIFLSIGYATCHWCHVMEHESFEDTTVARLMNNAFVCIKVDREERPDIDQIYMQVCQAMTGSGGWPLTIVMTPDKKPFFAGTYFPRQSRFQRIGLLELIPRIEELWKNRRAEILTNADKIVDFMQKNAGSAPGDALTEQVVQTAFEQLSSRYDSTYGGFGSAPKFPSPHNLIFMLRYGQKMQNQHALTMVEHTLQQMRLGGLFDHVGFGFHRYSTDQKWFLPHFEKMLYDQAMLAMAYLEASQASGNPVFANTAQEIFTYVLRDMTAPEGGFYSAEDADSEGEEGLFYLWTPEEIKSVLGEKESDFVIRLMHVEPGGNFTEQSSGQKTGKSILFLEKPLAEMAAEFGLPAEQLQKRWENDRQKLFAAREKRIHPLKDDKILTDWNGLMIAALAKGGEVLNRPDYTRAAQKAADFIWDRLRDNKGRLLKRYRHGQAALPAHADDYAFLIWGFLELYENTFELTYLERALQLNETMLATFWDEKNGGFFFAADSSAELFVRSKEIYDGAIPSANSVSVLNLLRLSRLTGNPEFENKALAIGKAFSQQINRAPSGSTQLLTALLFAFGPSYEIVVAGDPEKADTQAMLRALSQHYFPNKVVLLRPGEAEKPPISKLAAFTEFQKSIDGKATAYVCKNFACNAPTTDIGEMLSMLK